MWKKLRGLLGLSAFGAAAGAVVMPLFAWVLSNLGWSSLDSFVELVEWVALGVGGGAIITAGFATLLTTIEGKRTLGELSYRRVALFGALAGAALPVAFLLVTTGTLHFAASPGVVTFLTGLWAALGAGISTSIVGLAKRAHQEELAAVHEVKALAEEVGSTT